MPEQKKKEIVELFPGMRGFFVPETMRKTPDGKKAQMFVRLNDSGREVGRFFFMPDRQFIDVTKPPFLEGFLADPSTFDPENPSGFDPEVAKLLLGFKGNREGLKEFFLNHPEIQIFKQQNETETEPPKKSPAKSAVQGIRERKAMRQRFGDIVPRP